ncbi:Bug family tripartite tricarboxylate transporter substrate binding protein [Rhodoplanes sp. Z2-YC6860]|uniref:Bug family tripartite tricarboxylate transporter substrate binding protein n=1 Tax=Rhodoplanes sp. Z2-YC6860 TaxID=674703 RepID=UPI00078CA47F|nr:tripartite tricarboxylate transporter substrate binding protein [Rhodoplanes sp. Z2-YC6860]AMN40792.1 extra-cytoplasmic solute receptor [Rhodoplanes sp. Z2-YC6860]
MGVIRILSIAAMIVAAGVSAARAQSDYPNKPVHLIVGFIPGSSADITARVLGNRMSQLLGQQIVVENKPGAGSSLAAEYVARSPKDGYTLFVGSSANITNAAINPKLSFDMVKDFAPIALVNSAAVILVANPSVGVSSLKELIELAKNKPGEINYASTGVGTAPHLSGELLNMRAGLKLVHVPYQGSPQAATDLLAGRVQIMFSPASAVVAQVESGKLKVLASATAQRTGILPNVPTMAEAGMPDFVTSIWFGLMAPAGTPREIVDKLARAAIEAAKSPEVITSWRPQGIDPMIAGPDQFAKFVSQEVTRWGEVASAAGLKK